MPECPQYHCGANAWPLRRNRVAFTAQSGARYGANARPLGRCRTALAAGTPIRPQAAGPRAAARPASVPARTQRKQREPALAGSRCLYEINYFFLLESDRYLRPSTILSMMRASAEAPMKATIVTVINEIILIIFFLSLIYSSLLSLKAPPDAVAIV